MAVTSSDIRCSLNAACSSYSSSMATSCSRSLSWLLRDASFWIKIRVSSTSCKVRCWVRSLIALSLISIALEKSFDMCSSLFSRFSTIARNFSCSALKSFFSKLRLVSWSSFSSLMYLRFKSCFESSSRYTITS